MAPQNPPHILVVVPAHNEALNLPQVVASLEAAVPSASILVIDDGSTDDTLAVLDSLGVRWLGWPERRGVGAAVRAGLRYAARGGFTAVVRVDADGQHDAGDIRQLVAPILDGSADVALGSRYFRSSSGVGMTGLLCGTLAALMSIVIGRRVTDPTSGFCALSTRAIRLLATHYPDGYAEPELQLFLSRNRISCLEVPVQVRQRLSGTSSLTAPRLVGACARVLLALLIVPLRRVEASPHD